MGPGEMKWGSSDVTVNVLVLVVVDVGAPHKARFYGLTLEIPLKPRSDNHAHMHVKISSSSKLFLTVEKEKNI